MHQADFTIVPSGPFSLKEATTFGFGQRDSQPYEGVMRLAFCLDGYRDQVAVALRQDDDGVHGWVDGYADTGAVRAQVARVLSLDHDGEDFLAVGKRDRVVARLQAVAPGLRPPLFYSPYEAAAWSILSARRPAAQMARLREQLNRQHGRRFVVADQEMAAFPLPEQLLGIEQFPGLPDLKLGRLHRVATAALDGRLDADTLRSLPIDEAGAALRRLDGIGPFYSALVLIRATGHADLLPTQEPRLQALVAQLYDLPAPPGPDQLTALAEPWRPFRTWVAVLIRAATARL
ncbi:MAG: DNA-3-methyladenine glycosylase 2 family protein [Actinomycetota bacterium]|nr:DNA-3-methyladenine glycosylase 2 family protein [Actinomycetota bacterium]